MGSVFDALGEPRRRRILELLSAGERHANAIVAALQADAPISQAGVSQHLRVLRDAGLVTARAEGSRRVYALEPSGVTTAQRWLAELTDPLVQFGGPLDALATEVARGQRQIRRRSAQAPRQVAG